MFVLVSVPVANKTFPRELVSWFLRPITSAPEVLAAFEATSSFPYKHCLPIHDEASPWNRSMPCIFSMILWSVRIHPTNFQAKSRAAHRAKVYHRWIALSCTTHQNWENVSPHVSFLHFELMKLPTHLYPIVNALRRKNSSKSLMILQSFLRSGPWFGNLGLSWYMVHKFAKAFIILNFHCDALKCSPLGAFIASMCLSRNSCRDSSERLTPIRSNFPR